MLSVLISKNVASLLTKLTFIIVHQRFRQFGPFVLKLTIVFYLYEIRDINQTVLRRFELKSRIFLMDEQSNSWQLLQPPS